MNLKDFLVNREKMPELFWSLVMEPGWVQAGLWYIKGETADVVSIGPASPWETEEDLIGATDAALSSAIQKLPEDSKEPEKTVFGVPSSWVTGGEIKEEFLNKIKKICTELSLNPVGFVVLPEAIAHLYKSEEGAPVSAIVLGLGKEFLELSVFKLGNLVGTASVGRSVSIVEDVTEGLSRFTGAAPLPSRFIVYDGREGEVDDARDALLSATWEGAENVKFLHTPKVEALPTDRKVLATSLAGAAELGHASKVFSETEEKKEAYEKIPSKEDVENVSGPVGTATAAELGFMVGEDVSGNSPKTSFPPPNIATPAPTAKNITSQFSFSKIKTLFHSLTGKISVRPKINAGLGKNTLYIGLGIGAVILIAAFLSWWFLPSASVLVFVTPKSFSSDTQISVSVDGTANLSGAVIPGRLLDAKVSGDKTTTTTGSKLIGDKATGSVKIGNSTSSPVDLPAGTILASSGDLQFTLDNEASVSAGLDSFTPGTSTVSVTAGDIGAQYNLAKGENFTVASYPKSNVSAQSLTDFSGGTSREISAVSQDDQDKLEKDLTGELTQTASDNISGQVSSTEIAAPDLVAINKIDETFSSKIGDEASNLKFSLQLDTKGVAIDKSKLIEYAKSILKDKIPQGFVLRDDQINFKFAFLKLSQGKYQFKVTISANFLPMISTQTIVKQILGKSPDTSETYLATIPGFSRAEIKINPHLPGPLNVLPHIEKNLDLEIVGEK